MKEHRHKKRNKNYNDMTGKYAEKKTEQYLKKHTNAKL